MSKLHVDAITNRDGTNAVNFPDGIVGTAATFSGTVSIGGTLTYEDVTNIDSVGVITARSGINVSAGGAVISGVVTATSFDGSINTAGIITASSFSGDGSGLTFAPKIIAFNPVALGLGIAVDTNITITFDQNIQFAGTGTIEIRSSVYTGPNAEWTANTGTLVESFAITSGTAASGLSISGTQLIINPTSDLPTGSTIYVVLPSQGIQGTSGNLYYEGSNNYTFRTVSSSFSVQGGDIVFTQVDSTSPTGYHKFHLFTSSGILTTTGAVPTSPNDFVMVLVGGGGAGGYTPSTPTAYSYPGGGGGAGGVIRHTAPTVILATGDHIVTIGGGGDSSPYTNPGTDSSISHPSNTYTARGGGAGGSPTVDSNLPWYGDRHRGGPGGSGGGSHVRYGPPLPSAPPSNYFENTGPGGSNIAGQGNPGGGTFRQSTYTYPTSTAVPTAAGGGGGAGGAGGHASKPPYAGFPSTPPWPSNTPNYYRSMQSGNGGNGLANPEFPQSIISPQLPTTYIDLGTALGSTGTVGGGGGGGGPSTPTQWNPDTPSPNRNLIPGAGRGGSGGGGDGAMIKAAPFPGQGRNPQENPSGPAAQPGVIATGGGGGGSAYAPPSYPASRRGGQGGSGILMIRYASPAP